MGSLNIYKKLHLLAAEGHVIRSKAFERSEYVVLLVFSKEKQVKA